MAKTRLNFLIVLIALLVFAGLFTRQAGLLLLVTPLLVYLALGVLLTPQAIQLAGGRRVKMRAGVGGDGEALPLQAGGLAEEPRLVPAGSEVEVEVWVQNQGPGLAEVVIADGPWQHGTSLAGGVTSAWEYRFTPRRGLYRFGDLRITASDPFGLFTSQVDLPAPLEDQPTGTLLVLPESQALKRVPVRPFLLRGFAGPVAARLPGSGTDFYGVRSYQAGDSLRRLNWRRSSRHAQELFTNQYEGERFADIGLILDGRATRNLAVGEADLFESCVLAAASLGEAFLRDGHRLSLLIYGMGMLRLRPGSGRGQIKPLLRLLALAAPGHNYALDDLNYLPTRLYPPRSQIVFVSPLGREDFSPLVRFRAQGYDVLVVSPDPVDFEARHAYGLSNARQAAPEVGLALRLARIERALLLRRLQRYGIGVVDWQVNRSLAEALRRGLAPLQRGQRWLRA